MTVALDFTRTNIIISAEGLSGDLMLFRCVALTRATVASEPE